MIESRCLDEARVVVEGDESDSEAGGDAVDEGLGGGDR